MLFEKKEYINWEEYNKIISDIEHWCFIPNQVKNNWSDLK